MQVLETVLLTYLPERGLIPCVEMYFNFLAADHGQIGFQGDISQTNNSDL